MMGYTGHGIPTPSPTPFATASANAWRSWGLRTVTQPASRYGGQHKSQGARGYGQVKVAAEHASNREEPDQGGAVEGVPRGVRQDSHEHAPPRVVDDPHD